MNRVSSCGIVASLLMVAAVGGQQAAAQSREWSTVSQATSILDDIVATNKKGLPPLILRNAHAVAIIPNLVKGGFVFGARFGRGVVLVRTENGSWSLPIHVSLGGGSFGLQAGIQSTDLVLVFQNRQAVDSFIRGVGKLTLGVDGSIAVGGIGKFGALGTGAGLKAQYVAFSRNRGLFAGVAIDGATLQIDWAANSSFYGSYVSPAQIMAGQGLAIPQPALLLQTMLMQKTQLVALDIGVPGSTIEVVTPVEAGAAGTSLRSVPMSAEELPPPASAAPTFRPTPAEPAGTAAPPASTAAPRPVEAEEPALLAPLNPKAIENPGSEAVPSRSTEAPATSTSGDQPGRMAQLPTTIQPNSQVITGWRQPTLVPAARIADTSPTPNDQPAVGSLGVPGSSFPRR